MRYVFVSDIHGQYDKLMTALTAVSFNKDTDTLVSLGDPFDRGPNSYEVLKFLMNLPHRILVWGNHDDRLREVVVLGDHAKEYDYSNGMEATFESFLSVGFFKHYHCYSIDEAAHDLRFNEANKKVCDLLMDYFNECVAAIEFKDLIATHAWTPFYYHSKKKEIAYLPDWRDSSLFVWRDTFWSNSELAAVNDMFPEKPLLIGHWHAWRMATTFAEDRFYGKKPQKLTWLTEIDCSTFTLKQNNEVKLICIDGCTALHCGKVNTYVYETDETPAFYPTK